MSLSKTIKLFVHSFLASAGVLWATSGSDLIHGIHSVSDAERAGLAAAAGLGTAALSAAQETLFPAVRSVLSRAGSRLGSLGKGGGISAAQIAELNAAASA